VATRALESFDFDDAMLMDACAAPATRPFMSESAAIHAANEHLLVPSGLGLKAAKGALMAIGLESAAAVCLFGIWELWRSFR